MRALALLAALVVVLAGCDRPTGQPGAAPPPSSGTPSTGSSAPAPVPAPKSSSGHPTPGRPPADALPVGSSVHTVRFGGMDRSYRVFRPAKVPAEAPVVVMMHAFTGTAEQAERLFNWDPVASRKGVVMIYPEGVGRSWSGNGCCGDADKRHLNDVGFIEKAIAQVKRQIPVDDKRVYAAGMSNGGIMAYNLACKSDEFAAVGVVSGTMFHKCPSAKPVSVLHIHGDADPIVQYDGSPSKVPAGPTSFTVDGLSAREDEEFWQRQDDCGAAKVTKAGQNTVSKASCPGGRAVELATIVGGGHSWPLMQSNGFDTATLMWQFFAAHPKR